MQNPESLFENETHKRFQDFDKKMDYLIPAIQTEPVIVNQKKKVNLRNSELCSPHRRLSEKRVKYIDLTRVLRN